METGSTLGCVRCRRGPELSVRTLQLVARCFVNCNLGQAGKVRKVALDYQLVPRSLPKSQKCLPARSGACCLLQGLLAVSRVGLACCMLQGCFAVFSVVGTCCSDCLPPHGMRL